MWPIAVIGILGIIGELFYYNALDRGPGAPVIALTALYPLVSMLLFFSLLGERLSRNQEIGLILICVGLVIFLWDGKTDVIQEQMAAEVDSISPTVKDASNPVKPGP